MLEHKVRVEVLGLGEEADLGAQPHDRVLVAFDHRAGDLHLERHRAGGHALEQPEVEERHAPVAQQHRVAGVRISGELVVAVEAAEVEPEEDLADPVTLLLRVRAYLLEADALDELADQHALARELADDAGHHDEGMAAEDPGQGALVLRLQLVIELLLDPVADLVADRLGVESRGDPPGPGAGSSPGFWRSARTAAATPGYWTLTATARPSSMSRAR